MAPYEMPELVCSAAPTYEVTREWHWEKFTGFLIYHLFDAAGEPLYVGQTYCLTYRFHKHRRRPWWPDVAHMDLYLVPTRAAAVFWESIDIEVLVPRHNIARRRAA